MGKKKRMDLKVHKSTSVKRLKSPPQAVPLRRYMVVDGLGVAGAGWAASNLGPADPSAPRHRRALQR